MLPWESLSQPHLGGEDGCLNSIDDDTFVGKMIGSEKEMFSDGNGRHTQHSLRALLVLLLLQSAMFLKLWLSLLMLSKKGLREKRV